MRELSAGELLEVWDRTRGTSPAEAVLGLLETAMPDTPAAAIHGAPVGRRDAWLLQLRRLLFGDAMPGIATCPSCGEHLEVELRSLVLAGDPAPAMGGTREGDSTDTVGDPVRIFRDQDVEISYRVPTAADLGALAAGATSDEAHAALVAACLIEAHVSGAPTAPADLPESVVTALEAAIANADPQADVILAVECPECGRRSDVPLDLAGFLLDEIDDWAAQTLRQVAILASSFGWREAEILALSPDRRRYYLEAVGA